jgi:competence protein ComEC
MKTCRPNNAIIVAVAIVIILGVATAGCTNTFPSFRGNHLADNNGNLTAYFLDVGQGDSTLFVFDNKTILIDAGETDQGDRVVADLDRLGVKRVDLLVATHPHSDHIGGMQRVLAAFPVGRVLDTGLPHTSSTYENFLTTLDRKNIPYTLAEQGQTIDVDPSLRIFILSPPAQRFGDDPNTNSIVLRISYGTIDFLMTGDAGGEAEDALVKSGYALDAEILKVGHHGSEYSTSKAFLDRVNPEIAIISDGAGNPYGHPHRKTLDALGAAGIRVYRTDLDGTVRVRTDGVSYSVSTEKGQGSVWSVVATLAAPITNVTLNVSAIPTIPPVPANLSVPLPSLELPQIGNASSIEISEVQFDAPGDDRTNLNGEWVRLTNHGNDTVLLNGWTLSDRTASFSYIFPAYLLEPGSSVTIYTGAGTLNDTSLFMGLGTPVWGNGGDTAILRDFRGTIISERSSGGSG